MCNCNKTPQQMANGSSFEVKLPNGEIRIVETEHDAKIAITMAGGGTYSRR